MDVNRGSNERQRQASIRYVLDLDCVDAMVVGFETVGQLDDFAAKVRKVPRRGGAGKK